MYIKILVYIIDNQQVKYKISIIFFGSLVVCRSHFQTFVDWGGWDQKRQPGRPDFGEVVRPAYPYISLHVRHIPTYPAYPYMSGVPTYPIPHPLTTFSLILLYLRYN